MENVNFFHWLLTRRCQLKCEYCNIINNVKDVNYPNMKYYSDNEKSAEEYIYILERIKKKYPNAFHLFYGGEPLLKDDLYKIINYCNDNKIYYTIISNAIDKDKLEKLIVDTKIIKGYTCSVDPILFKEDKGISIMEKKSMKGLSTLIDLKNRFGDMIDCVAEITCLPDTYKYLPNLCKELQQHNIYADITFVDFKENQFYDFSNVTNNKMYNTMNKDEFKKVIHNLVENYSDIIHMPELFIYLTERIPFNSSFMPHCDNEALMSTIVIDADMTLRTCLRIKGYSKQTINDFINNPKEFYNDQMLHKGLYCEGCLWTCVYMSELINNQLCDSALHN